MKSSISRTLARAGAAIALALAGAIGSSAALAATLTPAGTVVSNLATMQYKVGGVDQPDIGSSPTGNTAGAGSATTFVVDNKIDLTVVNNDGGLVNVAPGAGSGSGTAQTLTFTLTNLGNYTQGYNLTAINEANGTTFSAATDSFDGNSCTTATASGTTTHVSALTPGASTTVFVVCQIPVAQANGSVSVIGLRAVTTDAGSSTTPITNGGITVVNGTNTFNVFADAAGTDDVGQVLSPSVFVKDGSHSDRGAFRVFASVLSVKKVAAALCDPVNGTSTPRNIPGAIVEYTVTISNTGSASASLTQISDTLQTANVTLNETYLAAGSVTSPSLCAAGASSGNAFKFSYSAASGYTGAAATLRTSPTVAATSGNYSAPTITLPLNTVLVAEGGTSHAAGELKAGESMDVKYQVLIK